MGRISLFYVRLISMGFKQRFMLANLTKVPVIGSAIERAFFEGDRMLILPKDGVAKAASEKVVTAEVAISAEQKDVVVPSKVLEEFIRRSKHHFIMEFCICRRSNECKDYPVHLGCLFLGRATLKIDRSLGRQVSMEEALEHVGKCREAGLVHLIGRNKIDSVWLDAFPKEELMTICSCCPCCCLWKMLPNISEDIGRRIRRMPGVSVSVKGDACTGCGACAKDHVCFVKAVSVSDGKARIDDSLCRGCGRCVEQCPAGAISLDIRSPDPVGLSVKEIENLVDLS
jgi:ferredoxin